jgi:4-diphosphocytidyl-2-C-methyl-D-erythritol kinase
MTMSAIRIFAPAKINLSLLVTGKRADGYHLLDSLVVFTAGIGDWVTITPAPSFSFAVTGPYAATLAASAPDTNLVVRAAHALAAATGQTLHCKITLEKNLPLASGIGGGSSDAAATLLGLVQFWHLPHRPAALEPIARQLGQDVVACLYRQCCAFQGIGDQIALMPSVPQLAILLVNPGVAVPTPAVFQARRGDFSAPAPFVPWPETKERFISELHQRRNDLTAAAIGSAPVIGACLAAVTATPDCVFAAMSGSGATCFGLYHTAAAAAAASASLHRQHPSWWQAAGHIPA